MTGSAVWTKCTSSRCSSRCVQPGRSCGSAMLTAAGSVWRCSERTRGSLHIGNAEQEELLYLLQSRTREQRRQLLRGAALGLCGELETGDAWSRGYVTAFAESLLPRLDAALWAGGRVQYLYCGERVRRPVRKKNSASVQDGGAGGCQYGICVSSINRAASG